jgi:hypothetical protein
MMTTIAELEQLQEMSTRFGDAAVVASALKDLTVVVSSLRAVLGEIDSSQRGVCRNLHGILQALEKVNAS